MKWHQHIPSIVLGLAAMLALAYRSEAAADSQMHGEPLATNYALSYDGSKMIVLRKRGQRQHYDVIDTSLGDSRRLLERSFASMSWGEDSNTAYASVRGRGIYRLSFALDEVTVVPIALTGKQGIPPAEKPRVLRFPKPLDRVLLARGDGRLYRCALDPVAGGPKIAARCEIADDDAGRVLSWLVAVDGRIVARFGLLPSGDYELQTRIEGGGWRPVFRYTPNYTILNTIGSVQKDNTVWALSNRGRTHVALVRLDVSTGQEVVVYEHRRVDIDGAIVLFDKAGNGLPLLATHFPGYQEVVHFESRLEVAYAALREKLGERLRIDFYSSDRALTFVVVEVRSPKIYRRWYLLDLEGNTFRELSAGQLVSYERPAEPSRPVSFPASDGLMLHGYLTQPQRRVEVEPPPMVLMLHGGPWARERWPGSSLDSFLGSRGYAVLRLNYRGSFGYGRDFMDAGKGAVFGRLQRDVLDAAHWAVAEGHAAEGRIALYGGSFGGFLALTTLARHPDVSQAGIVVNAPVDAVAFWKRDWSRDASRALWKQFLKSRDLPEAALARLSPINNVRKLNAPVLLLAGAQDRRVPAEQSFELFDLLRMAGKPAELVEYRGLGHNIWGGNPETREHIASRIHEFLAEHLPVGP